MVGADATVYVRFMYPKARTYEYIQSTVASAPAVTVFVVVA